MPWAETSNLQLDDYGRLSRVIDPGEGEDLVREDLGHVEWAEVPDALAGELAELLDAWRDAPGRGELHAGWNDDYYATRGVR